jgi:hypothetical protein
MLDSVLVEVQPRHLRSTSNSIIVANYAVENGEPFRMDVGCQTA